MKNKKLLLPAIILAVAVLATAVYSVITSIAKKPTVTEGAFPFSVTYELDGERVTIEDVYKVQYVQKDGQAKSKSRVYVGEMASTGEDDRLYTIKKDENSRVELWTRFHPDYLMGDPEYDYIGNEAFEPVIYYYDSEEVEYSDEETLAAQGVKLIGFAYPTPVENTFVFSHLSYLSGAVVFPVLLIALLALVAIIIFVKKEKELKYKAVDVVSIVFNCIVGSVYLVFVTVLALLIDIEGGGPELYYQVLYFIPALSALGIAASVALRRKGYGVKALLTGFVGPAVFAVYLVVCYAGGRL